MPPLVSESVPDAALVSAPVDETERLTKKILATEACALLHGRDAAEAAAETARRTFEEGVTAATLPSFVSVMPSPVVDVLVASGMVSSKSEARRLIVQGGAKLNDAPIADVAAQVTEADLRDGAAKLSLGKKKHLLVRPG
jgi:tyrosyl-tRNA synthetase